MLQGSLYEFEERPIYPYQVRVRSILTKRIGTRLDLPRTYKCCWHRRVGLLRLANTGDGRCVFWPCLNRRSGIASDDCTTCSPV